MCLFGDDGNAKVKEFVVWVAWGLSFPVKILPSFPPPSEIEAGALFSLYLFMKRQNLGISGWLPFSLFVYTFSHANTTFETSEQSWEKDSLFCFEHTQLIQQYPKGGLFFGCSFLFVLFGWVGFVWLCFLNHISIKITVCVIWVWCFCCFFWVFLFVCLFGFRRPFLLFMLIKYFPNFVRNKAFGLFLLLLNHCQLAFDNWGFF